MHSSAANFLSMMVLDLCQFQHNFTSHWRHDQLLDYASATFWTNHPRQVLGRFIRYKNDALIATYEGYIYVFWSIFYIAADMHMDTHISKSYRGLWISIFCTRGTVDTLSAASPIGLRFFSSSHKYPVSLLFSEIIKHSKWLCSMV